MVFSEVSGILGLVGNDLIGSSVIFGIIIIVVCLVLALMIGIDAKMALIIIAPAILGLAGYGLSETTQRFIPAEYAAIVWFMVALVLAGSIYGLYLFMR